LGLTVWADGILVPHLHKAYFVTTKGFTSAGLTGQAIPTFVFNLAFVLGLTERYSATEFICNYYL
jgi:hypothetical protein